MRQTHFDFAEIKTEWVPLPALRHTNPILKLIVDKLHEFGIYWKSLKDEVEAEEEV